MRLKKSFLKGAGVLAVCALIAKIIGALYRIPLTNVLGAEGIGLYQMVFPLYTVLLTVSSGGLPVAISKAVAARGKNQAHLVIKYALISLVLAGGAAMLVIAVFHRLIAALQGNGGAALAYLGIAPSLLFVAVISCFRGYFQGRQNMLPTALSQLVEQIVKLVLGLFLAGLLLPYGVEYGVLGSVLGVTLSELAAMSGLLIHYLIVRKRHNLPESYGSLLTLANGEKGAPLPAVVLKNIEAAAELSPLLSDTSMADAAATLSAAGSAVKAAVRKKNKRFLSVAPADEMFTGKTPCVAPSGNYAKKKKSSEKAATAAERKCILREIYRVAIPVTLGSLVLPLTQVFDSLLVVNILSRVGSSLTQATSLYGLVTGPVNSLINMPSVITLSLSGALLPKVSQLFSRGESVAQMQSKAMRTAVLSGLLFSLGLFLTAEIGMRILYSSGLSVGELRLSTVLLRLGSLSVLYVSILQVATAMLQGTDRAHIPAVNLMIGAAVKVVFTLILLPIFGIAGAVAATVACYAVTCLLDVIALKRHSKKKRVKQNDAQQ